MAKFFFLSILLISHLSVTFSQSVDRGNSKLVCKYKHTFQPFLDDSTRIESNVILLLNDHLSKYMDENAYEREKILDQSFGSKNDSEIVSNFQSVGKKINAMSGAKSNNFLIYKEYKTREIKITHKPFQLNYSIKSNIDFFKWEIDNEKRNIAGYQCTKAVLFFGEKVFTAWFTPEIPVSDGPFIFSGLPGLILSISDKEKTQCFEIIEVKKEAQLIKDTSGNKNYIKAKALSKKLAQHRKLVNNGYNIEQAYLGQQPPLLEENTEVKRKELLLKYSLYDQLLLEYDEFIADPYK